MNKDSQTIKLKQFVKKFSKFFTNSNNYSPTYRVLSIEQDETEEYQVVVQITNKAHTFKLKPEEILADDKLTSAFSPIDIRTLTYLGYLGINGPKYKILANQMSKDSTLLFAIKEKGKTQPIMKTAEEIAQDADLVSQMSQEDAHKVGYTAGSQTMVAEERMKREALEASLSSDDVEKS